MRTLFTLSMLALFIVTMARADVASGPDVGADVKPLKVAAVTGDQAGKEVDYAELREDKPTIYVFVHADRFDRPAGRFLKKLDDIVKMQDGKAEVVAVWLTGNAEASKTRLMAIQNSLQFGSTVLTVYPSLTDLPDGWGLNTDANVTVVVAADKKVTANFAYVSINETVVREVAAELKNVVK